MRAHALRIACIGSSVLVPLAAAPAPDWVRYLDREVVRKIEVAGYRTIGYHDHRIDGDREAYNTLNYGGQGARRITDIGQLRLTGRRVLGVFNFDATILDSRFTDPQGQKWSVDMARGPWSLKFGDIQGSLLNTNRFLAFDKSLSGVQAGYQRGRFAARAVQSEAKGSARTITIQGTNSPGPYYLQNSQIVPGSERVQLDGQDMRLGTDYVVNYEVGSLTFIDRTISLTSSIVVTYEAFGFNARRGIVEGAGASYDLGRGGKLGVTLLRQRARTGGVASTRLESFQGFGAPSTPYFLQFEPLRTQTITVRVNGVLQIQGADYVFDPDNAAIFYFTRFMPATDVIDVVYTPVPRTTADGDRENVGLDYRLPLGEKGRAGELSLAVARGRLYNTATPLSGTARGARLTYRHGMLDLTANARDVPEGFVSVESRSFNRNERAYDWQIGLRPGGPLRFGASQGNSAVRTRSVDGTGATVFRGTRAAKVRVFAETDADDASQRWRLEHRRQDTRTPQGESRVDATSLNTSQRAGTINWQLALDRQTGYGPSGTAGARSTFRLMGTRLSASYNPSSTFNTQLVFGVSDVKLDGARSTGRDSNLAATWNPSRVWGVRGSYLLSDSGSIATLGRFTNGSGLGFDGNGFTGGAGTTTSVLGATNVEATQLAVAYTPSDRISMNLGWIQQRSTGSVSSNSRTSSLGWAASADLGAGHQLSASVDRSETTFADSPLRSEATTYGLFYSARPKGPWSYSLGSSLQFSGGTRQYAQDSLWYEASLAYQIAPRHSLVFSGNGGGTRGYLPQDGFEAGLTYVYRIWRSLGLNVSYRVRDVRNRDGSVTSGAYRSRGFDVELNFQLEP